MLRDLLGQIAVRPRLCVDPFANRCDLVEVADASVVPAQRAGEQDPLATAVIRVAEVAVDPAAGTKQLTPHALDSRLEDRVVERQDAEGDTEPEQARVETRIVRAAREAPVCDEPLEQRRADLVGLGAPLRCIEQPGCRIKPGDDRPER